MEILFTNQNLINSFSMALLHSLWQGIIIGIALWIILKSIKAQKAPYRYIISVLALTTLVAMLFITWGILQQSNRNLTQSTTTITISSTEKSSQQNNHIIQDNSPKSFQTEHPVLNESHQDNNKSIPWKKWFLFFWAMGTGMMLIRMMLSVIAVKKIHNNATRLDNNQIESILLEIKTKLNLSKKIIVLASDQILSPCITGVFNATILLPLSISNGNIPIEDLKMILAHELAHIKRHDYLINLIQLFIESILFFNPAVWLISRQIRLERESCCDMIGKEYAKSDITYAKVLTNWALKISHINHHAATLGFTETLDPNQSSILNRVKRILNPNDKPGLRLPWPTTLVLLLFCFLGCVGLKFGADKTVKTVSAWLTPQQRIEKIQTVTKSYKNDHYLSHEDHIEEFSGSVSMASSGKIPPQTKIHIHASYTHNDETYTEPVTGNSFSFESEPAKISLYAKAPGYQSDIYGPYSTKSIRFKDPIKLILKKSISMNVKFIDKNNNAIPNVHVTGYHLDQKFFYELDKFSNQKGELTFKDISSESMELSYEAEGYENGYSATLNPKKNHTELIKLNPSTIIQGNILSQKTGEPIEGVNVYLKSIDNNRKYFERYEDAEMPLLTSTNTQGKFEIDSLRNDCRYILKFKKNQQFTYEYDVVPGCDPLEIQLPEPYVIKGKFNGPLDHLQKQNGKYVINYRCYLYHSGVNRSAGGNHFVNVDNNGYFAINKLSGNTIRIGQDQIGGNIPIQLWDNFVEYDLSSLSLEQQKRKIIFNFNVPENHPSPSGEIKVIYFPGGNNQVGSNHSMTLPIENFQATCELPTPCNFRYNMHHTIGYWFEGQWDTQLEHKDEPLTINISAIPAGAIHGEVLGPDGLSTGNTMLYVSPTKNATRLDFRKKQLNRGFSDLTIQPNEHDINETRFTATPLPLGGTYVIIAKQNHRYAISEPIHITKQNPIAHVTLQYQTGQQVTGQIVDENGTPLSNIGYSIMYNGPKLGLGGVSHFTDENGKFILNDINFDIKQGDYSIQIKPSDTWQKKMVKLDPNQLDMKFSLSKGKSLKIILVEDETGYPIPNIRMYARSTVRLKDNRHHTIVPENKTNKNGEFQFTKLKDLVYEITCFGNNLSLTKEYLGKAGQTETLIMRANISNTTLVKPNKVNTKAIPKTQDDGMLENIQEYIDYRSDLNMLNLRISKLSMERKKSTKANQEYESHLEWLIKNHPEHFYAGSSCSTILKSDYDLYNKIENLWNQLLTANPNNANIMGNMARFYTNENNEKSIHLYQKAKSLDPSNYRWPNGLAHLYKLQSGRQSQHRDTLLQKALTEYELGQSLMQDKDSKIYTMPYLAQIAFDLGQYEKAKTYAEQLIKISTEIRTPGIGIFHGNHLLGRLAMLDNDIPAAKKYLQKAGKTSGGPALNSFGPKMTLAKELLEVGEKEVVLEYFSNCRKFWSRGNDKLDQWTQDVKNDRIPNFQKHLK